MTVRCSGFASPASAEGETIALDCRGKFHNGTPSEHGSGIVNIRLSEVGMQTTLKKLCFRTRNLGPTARYFLSDHQASVAARGNRYVRFGVERTCSLQFKFVSSEDQMRWGRKTFSPRKPVKYCVFIARAALHVLTWTQLWTHSCTLPIASSAIRKSRKSRNPSKTQGGVN